MTIQSRFKILPLGTLCAAAILCAPAAKAAAPVKPNIIVILADDLGIGDLSCSNPGSKIQTPNLDRFAQEGINFSDAHTSSSVCTPTRYGLITGRYNWRSRLARGVLHGDSPHLIPDERATMADVLKGAGYHTAMLGKWHLGWDWALKKDGKTIDFTKPVTNGPDINGFDTYKGFCGSLDMPPYVWVKDGKATAQPAGDTGNKDKFGMWRTGPTSPDFNHEQVLPQIFEWAGDHVKERAKTDQPFFLYLPLPAPHTPILPLPSFEGSSGLNVYGDFVMQIDHHMGELMTAIKDAGIDKNTLVVFTSDNGCSPRADIPGLNQKGHYPSMHYRGNKACIYEGGHRVPFMVRWPEGIPARQTTEQLACLTDLLATFADITGQKVPDNVGEDSFSLRSVLQGEGPAQRKTLISHSISGVFAIRQGPWKLICGPGSGGWSYPDRSSNKSRPLSKKEMSKLPQLQLYNMEHDVGEHHNLAAAYPEQVDALLELLKQEVDNGRITPGKPQSNDRDVKFIKDNQSE